jgi:hypothetical protein
VTNYLKVRRAGRGMSRFARFIFFDDVDHSATMRAYAIAVDEARRGEGTVSVWREPGAQGPWSGLPLIAASGEQ